jgi:hypothetical protein
MKISILTLRLSSSIAVAALFGAVASAQAGIVVQIAPPAIVVGQPAVVVAPAPVVEYAPNPFDVYITNVAPADVVYLHGDTFIWAIDASGHRYQRFYAHGDHRQEIFHRRDELHRVMARNGGRLPDHGADHRAGEVRRDEHQAARPGERREEDHR